MKIVSQKFYYSCIILHFSFFFFNFSLNTCAQGNSLLWRISGKNLEHPSYLYGTMHSSDPRVFHFADSVLPAFEKCEAFAMEVVVDENTQSTMMQNVFMENGGTLKNLLTQRQYDSVQYFAMWNAGLMISYFEKMKPLYVAMMLEMMSGNDSIRRNNDPFLDQYLESEARSQRKVVLGIETVEEQMDIFDVMTYSDQARLLMKSVREYSDDTAGFHQMVQYYLSNDLHKMMSFENDLSLPDSLYRALITDRNMRMAIRIDTMIQHHSTFVAVGAGHLGEDDGVIALLRTMGYTVLPVIPVFNHLMKDGWYQITSSRNNFTAEFPSVPVITTDTMKGKIIWLYSLSNKDQISRQEDFRVIIFPASIDDDDIRVFLSVKNIADITLNKSTEEKYYSVQRNDKMRGRCVFLYSGDKRYVILYASAHMSKDVSRFAGSFSIK